MTSERIYASVLAWAGEHDVELVQGLALSALDVERADTDQKRKDLGRWSQFRETYGFFFNELFQLVHDPRDARFHGLTPELVRSLARDFAAHYREEIEQPLWFQQVRDLADRYNFAPNNAARRKDPDRYVGVLKEAAGVIRVLLTGSTRSPDLHAVARVLGSAEVQRRVNAVVD